MPSTAARRVTTVDAGGAGGDCRRGSEHRASMTAGGRASRPPRRCAATGGSGTSPIEYAPPPSGRGSRIGHVGGMTGWTFDATGTQRRAAVAAGVVGAVVLGVLAGCGAGRTSGSQPLRRRPPVRSTGASLPAVALPDLVGKGLQAAEDEAQAAGFFALTSHDALGQRRDQVQDREWTVCFQDPAAGSAPSSTLVDLGAVRLGEACPATDQGTATAVDGDTADGTTVPDVVGLSVAQATRSLGSDAGDAARRDRSRSQRRRRPQLAGLRPGAGRGGAARRPGHAARWSRSPRTARSDAARQLPPSGPARTAGHRHRGPLPAVAGEQRAFLQAPRHRDGRGVYRRAEPPQVAPARPQGDRQRRERAAVGVEDRRGHRQGADRQLLAGVGDPGPADLGQRPPQVPRRDDGVRGVAGSPSATVSRNRLSGP